MKKAGEVEMEEGEMPKRMILLVDEQKKVVKDQEGFDRMIHPLSACNALRIEETNHIYFACQYYDNR